MFKLHVAPICLLAVMALSGGYAHADPHADQVTESERQPTIPPVFATLTADLLAKLNQVKQKLEREVPASDNPLPYHAHNGTLDSIPDARQVHRGDCRTYSVAFRNILVEQYGFNRESLLAGLAYDELSEPHMVLLIKVMDKGRPQILVYDSRFNQIMTLAELTTLGYRWWAREKAPDGVVINWDGTPFS